MAHRPGNNTEHRFTMWQKEKRGEPICNSSTVCAFLMLIFLCVIAGENASARLSDTLEQCISRYGTVVDPGDKTGFILFYKEPYVVFVKLYHQRVGQIGFLRLDGRDMSETEIKLLLHDNTDAAGSEFSRKGASDKNDDIWMADNAAATYNRRGKSLIISLLSLVAHEEGQSHS